MIKNGFLFVVLGLVSLLTMPVLARNYYVNSQTGNDANPGTSRNNPWKSLTPVNGKDFMPGDTVNFECGSVWEMGLVIKSSGTKENPLVFRAIGTGEKPVFSNEGKMTKAVDVTGKWVIVDGLMAKNANQAGIYLAKGADHTIVRNCEIANAGAGVMIHGRFSLITNNYAHDLVMVKNTQGGDDDYGAVAYWVFNSNNEISYNRAVRCRAPSYDYGADGGFFEVYSNGDSTFVHHNYAEDCNGFLEIGGGTARNITVSDNVSVENGEWTFHLTGKFKADIQQFRIEHNTIISRKGTRWNNILGLSKAAVLDPNALVFKDNFIVLGGEATEKVANQGGFIHENNTYFLLDGAKIGYPLTPGEVAHVSK